MAKKNQMLLPLDPLTGELLSNGELPFRWSNGASGKYIKVYDPKYEGLSVIMSPNDPFYAKLRIDHMATTCGGPAHIILKNVVTDTEYLIYSKEFNQILDRFIEDGILEGHWVYTKKSNRYTIAGV
jgi:hypothetical protein